MLCSATASSATAMGRVTIRAALLVATASVVAATVAGCGTGSHAPVADTVSSARLAAARRTVDPATWARVQARGLARRMLAESIVPRGARRLRPGQWRPRALKAAETLGNQGQTVVRTRVYLVDRPEWFVADYLRTYHPDGTADFGYGSDTSGRRTEQDVSYSQAATPDGVSATFLIDSMLPAAGGRTWLRVDAMVIWCLPRTAAEHIEPARYRAVVVSGRPRLDSPTITRTFSAPSVVAELAGRLNAMPSTGGFTSFCVSPFSISYRLVFEPKTGQARRIVATQVGCDDVQVTVAGRRQPVLADSTGLEALVAKLL
jgi:hypothetical protein